MHGYMDAWMSGTMDACIHGGSIKSTTYSQNAEIFLLKCPEKKVRYG
jgi:hypothetical protein